MKIQTATKLTPEQRSKFMQCWDQEIKSRPLLSGIVCGIGTAFIGVIAFWLLAWLIHFLPWPAVGV